MTLARETHAGALSLNEWYNGRDRGLIIPVKTIAAGQGEFTHPAATVHQGEEPRGRQFPQAIHHRNEILRSYHVNIVICIKQVPDTTEVRINPETNTLVRDGVESIINPFDVYAIEEGVRIRERLGEGKVTVLTMGPPQAEAALREAISVGVDDAVLLQGRAFAGGDTWATSLSLALAVKKLNPDVVLTGKQAIDGDTAQVGPGISCHLDWPQACYVSKIRDIKKGLAVVECLMETGKEVLEVQLPAVLTVVKEINEPRLPSFKGKMRAKKAELTVWSDQDIGADPEKVGLKGSPTAVNRIFSPPRRGGGEMIVADSAAEAGRIAVAKIKALQIA